ncbi:F-box-like domain containing protein, partial [Pyrenophora tritici-repentis]
MNHLPNEILLLIFSYVDFHREARILGYIPDDPPPTPVDQYLIEDFRKCSVRNLALTCKRFAHFAQEVLLYAPVLDATFPHTLAEFESCGIVSFVRKLRQNPELSRYIKQLRICWSERTDGEPHNPDNDAAMSVSPAVLSDLESQMSRLETRLNFPRPSQRVGFVTPFGNLVERSVPVLLSLLPHLETLCISDPYLTGPTHWSRTGMKSGHALSYLKVERSMMIVPDGLLECPRLQTLDLSLKIQGRGAIEILDESEMFRGVGIPYRLSHNIQHIRLDFEVKTVGIWNTTSRAYMNNIIHAFSDLESLTYYAESSASKNPYR